MITFAFRGVTGVNSVLFEQLPVFGAFHSHGQWTIPIYIWMIKEVYMEVSYNRGTRSSLDGLFHGKSHL